MFIRNQRDVTPCHCFLSVRVLHANVGVKCPSTVRQSPENTIKPISIHGPDEIVEHVLFVTWLGTWGSGTEEFKHHLLPLLLQGHIGCGRPILESESTLEGECDAP
ncbi:hypothetical protein CBL_12216 [Carabus blaptoides fortunei]